MYDPRPEYDGGHVLCAVSITTDIGNERVIPCKYYGPTVDQNDEDTFVVTVDNVLTELHGIDREIVAHKEDLYESHK